MERENVTKLKNAKTIDFTRFQGGTPVFLTMYRKEVIYLDRKDLETDNWL